MRTKHGHEILKTKIRRQVEVLQRTGELLDAGLCGPERFGEDDDGEAMSAHDQRCQRWSLIGALERAMAEFDVNDTMGLPRWAVEARGQLVKQRIEEAICAADAPLIERVLETIDTHDIDQGVSCGASARATAEALLKTQNRRRA